MNKHDPAKRLAAAADVMQLIGVAGGVLGVAASLIVCADGRFIEGAQFGASAVVVAVLFVFLACWARAWQDVAGAARIQQRGSLTLPTPPVGSSQP